MKKFFTVLGVIAMLFAVSAAGVGLRWYSTWRNNTINYIDQKIDDATRYETRKNVEDSCRAMVASYEADKLTWMQYKDSDKSEQQSWADQAKMRANRTAVNYNEYVLKNSYVWDGNIPTDILGELDLIS